MLLHAATPEAGHAQAQRLCDAARAKVFAMGDMPLTVTVSIGLAGAPDGDTLEALLLSADRRLYVAKVSGRDRVVGTDAPAAFPDAGRVRSADEHGPLRGRVANANADAESARPAPGAAVTAVGDGRAAQTA